MTDAPPHTPQTRPPARCRAAYLLALLTTVAAVVRFVGLTDPAVRDEELRHGPLDPLVLRWVAAVAGTLLIPAVYFLVRQWSAARVALVAAAVSACSGLLVSHSREASFTPVFCLAATLSGGCLLAWLRGESRGAWLVWVASAAVAVVLSPWGVAAIAVELLVLVFRRRGTVPVELPRPGPAIASPRFLGAAAVQEARVAALFAIGVAIALGAYAWWHEALPVAPRIARAEIVPALTAAVLGFRWSYDTSAAGVAPAVAAAMTTAVVTVIVLLMLAPLARAFRASTRGMLAALVGLVLVVNVAQVTARAAVRTAPPTHLLARDLIEGSHAGGMIATYVNPTNAPDGPVARSPALLYAMGDAGPVRFHAFDPRELAATPHVKRVIVWNGDATAAPGDGWRLVRDNAIAFYDPWTWRHRATWRRREFVRIAPLPQVAPPPDDSLAAPSATRPAAT